MSHEITEKHIVEHVLHTISWVSTHDLTHKVASHCIDGREHCAVVGAPGGDAGEFLLMIAAYERISEELLDVVELSEIFNAYLKWNGHFYMHTDEQMLHHLLLVLRQDELFHDYFGGQLEKNMVRSVEELVRHPPVKLQDALLEHLLSEVHLGCGHLSLLKTHADEYGIRDESMHVLLESFYTALWCGEGVTWAVLHGTHTEQAVVNVFAVDTSPFPSHLPLVCPYCRGKQVFINHPQAEQLIILHMYSFLLFYFKKRLVFSRDAFVAVATDLLQRHVGSTLLHLASGLPIYDAYVSRNGECTVVLKGRV